jgi:hypothetical protein
MLRFVQSETIMEVLGCGKGHIYVRDAFLEKCDLFRNNIKLK